MTTKDIVLQEAINILIIQGKQRAIDIEAFNYYYRKFGNSQLNITIMAIDAAQIMEREYREKVYEYEKREQIFSTIET